MAASCMRCNSHTESQWPSKPSKGGERSGDVSRRNAPSHTRTHTEGAACTYRVTTVRTRRVYLSCFYRLTRTSGPGYADEDDDDDDDDGDGEDEDEDDDDGGDEEKAKNKVGEGRTTAEW
ncbi:hypothetical protein ALC57_16332 [Trachymyrmex cornetzi]|uniref:Uncharacterized protein n=1 Tax=Trachymyrmex cornetzi TaxID=471704 RepID=A0A195DF75_9HYME|nr:hypothetical protein ALC57_16332 [Trachymyrmex cornetzi]